MLNGCKIVKIGSLCPAGECEPNCLARNIINLLLLSVKCNLEIFFSFIFEMFIE